MNGDIGKSSDIPRWKSIARKHREHQLSLIPSKWRLKDIPLPEDHRNAIPLVEQHLSPEELTITSLSQSLPTLQSAIKSRQLTAVQVVSAFCHRAAILQQLTNCLTEILFSTALETARQHDAHLQSTGTLLGPLHGIPISVKDNQDIKDIDSTLGWVGLIDKPAKSDAPCVHAIRSAAGIMYCKTNLPQSMMMSDSYNHVYGQSVNSLSRLLISGGSSGGEAALVAAGGSLVGIGTDIGGSVRIPATLHGLYGLNPSIGRIGNRESSRRDKYVVPPVAGPLSRDLDTLEAFLHAYSSTDPWTVDPAIVPIPWRTDLVSSWRSKESLTIGYILDDGMIKPQPPVERAVQTTINTFTSVGHHKTINLSSTLAPSHSRAYSLWLRAVLADGGSRFQALCSLVDEPLIPGMLVGNPSTTLDVDGRMALYDEIYAFQREYMAAWNELEIDCLIMPVTQWVGLRPKEWVKREMYVGYTSIWNLMNWTSLAVPGFRVDRRVDGATGEDWDGYQARSTSDRLNHDGYDVDLVEGMPVGVQIVTGRLEEEKAVGIARLLEDLRKS